MAANSTCVSTRLKCDIFITYYYCVQYDLAQYNYDYYCMYNDNSSLEDNRDLYTHAQCMTFRFRTVGVSSTSFEFVTSCTCILLKFSLTVGGYG